VIGLACGQFAAASVTATVDWSRTTGKNVSGRHFGLNLFQGFDPTIAGHSGSAAYNAHLARMKPGMVRYHRWDMIQDSVRNSSGWATGLTSAQTIGWDADKINKAMSGANTWGATVMVNIPGWPDAWKTRGTSLLDPSHYSDFANWCASLVRIINVNQGRAVKYWEVTNEQDDNYGSNAGQLGLIVALAASAMKAVDSTIQVGGPAFARPDRTSDVDAFFSTSASDLDFVSYHTYASGSTSDSNQSIFNTAAGWGSITSSMKAEFAKYSSRRIEYFHDEYNISWNPPDVRMYNEIGMVADALSMISIANAGADGAMAWNEADGWYGKVDASWNSRPSAYLYELVNNSLSGSIVQTSTSDASQVVLFGTISASWVKLAMVNRSETNNTVAFSSVAGLPAGATNHTSFTVKQVSSGGVSDSTVTIGQLQKRYLLPANTVTIIELNTSAIHGHKLAHLNPLKRLHSHLV
jgi:xylan 1,4-beta-xylosidase